MRLNYKYTFIFFYILSVIILVSSFYFFNTVTNESSVNNITNNNFKNIIKEKEKYTKDFIYSYQSTIDALIKNKSFKNYINNKEDKKNSAELFLTFLRASSYISQIRYIDITGKEQIRVENSNLSNYTNIDDSKIILDEKLQNKSNREYFKDFIQLKKYEIGISQINLNKEFGKIIKPKMPIVRVAKIVLDKNFNKKGFIVLNISLDNFLLNLKENPLYNIYLVDDEGRFIIHPNHDYDIYSDKFDSYTLSSQFGELNAKNILSYNQFFNNNFYSKRLKKSNSGFNITLIIKSKYEDISKKSVDKKLNLIFILIFISFLAFPIVFYFAGTPERLEKKIIQQFITDDLTKLPNLEHLFNDLKDKDFDSSITILINISNYKNIQNIYGFEVVSELIKESAIFLEKIKIKDNNILKIYKIKVDTFAFKYNFTDKRTLKSMLIELQNTLESKEFTIFDKYEISIDPTIGVSSIEEINNEVNQLKEAELALNDALEFNLDISIYNISHMENLEKNKNNLEKIKMIKDAIVNNNVLIALQPIYNNYQERIEKYEVLVRLKYQDKIIYPDDFLQISKKIKKYKTLTKIIIDKSFRFFEDKDYEFSINLSIEDISDKEIQEYLFRKIVEHNVKNRLVIELVETEAINNYETFTNFIKKIKELECKIAIDDFGSGYSNYDYIIKLSEYIDYLKIDGSLIKDIDTNKKTQLLVGTLKFLCDSLRIRTIAEYVENKEIFDFIRAMNINYSQGYYIGKPSFELIKDEDLDL